MSESNPISISDVEVSTAYISASANRFSRVATSSVTSLVAFGSSNAIALWQSASDRGVLKTLHGHNAKVTCVRFDGDEHNLFSTDDGGYLMSWRLTDGEWKNITKEKAHSQAISALAVLNGCLVTGSSDSSMAVWTYNHEIDDIKETQKIKLNGKYPLDIQLALLPESNSTIMAVALTNRTVSIWTKSSDSFLHTATLSGHDDWVKSLAFQSDVAGPNILTLASASQDGTIRLWNIEKYTKSSASVNSSVLSDELLDTFEAALGDVAEGEEGGRQISLKRHIITVKSDVQNMAQFSVTFDALLVGHDAGVTSVCWRPRTVGRPPALLSSSTDSSVILWSQTSIGGYTTTNSASIWVSEQRFGDVGGQRLGGFVGCLWSQGGDRAMAWGWAGGWRSWLSNSDKNGIESWTEVGAISGHRGIVRDVNWSPGGEYLISTGPDQTTRIHSPVNRRSSTSTDEEIWHEISRPQVHGYDLNEAVFITSTTFVSVSDEKVARVFEAPKGFVTLAKHLGILDEGTNENERPVGASVPPLGLSNKASDESRNGDLDVTPSSITKYSRRPFEGELALATLWPEVEKVFGHGYELYTVSISHSRTIVATACKASSLEHAVIRLYDARTWRPFGPPLQGHELTVTRIAFSPDDRYILSVSRDRTFCLFERSIEMDSYHHISREVGHARIIWDCSWSPDGAMFSTASRDKTVKFWKLTDRVGKKWLPHNVIKAREAATSVAFALNGSPPRVAIGFESGAINMYSLEADTGTWKELVTVGLDRAHTAQITCLAWRPGVVAHAVDQLASSSEDGTLRIFNTQSLRT